MQWIPTKTYDLRKVVRSKEIINGLPKITGLLVTSPYFEVNNLYISMRTLEKFNVNIDILSSLLSVEYNGKNFRNYKSDKIDFVDMIVPILSGYHLFTKDTFNFVKLSASKLVIESKNGTCSYWEHCSAYDCFLIIDYNGNKVGIVKMSKSDDTSMHIQMIEIFEKNRGIGSKVVAFLLEKYNCLTGFCLTLSHEFWVKQGALIDESTKCFTLGKRI